MSAEPVTINVRQTTGTYVAKAPGLKPTASCTTGPRQAAESLAKKLGLAPGLIQEQPSDGLGYGCSRFTHSGDLATNTSNKAHCPHCGICHTRTETCNEARKRAGVSA
ncbi:hypothetical protein [Pseudomonas putida]|uniref:hypothetical protein n=1 Tax=Pseudomonas putida TaxID=303 RepID=UPI002022BB78|nr:hypothetical protein [Pseudomonas putida]MCL8304598.1 hypothetical protein [Pseudomonas putida]